VKRAIAVFRRVTDALLVALFAFMVAAVCFGVAGRYFHFKISYSVELATYAQIWMTAIGAGVALRFGALFALDTLSRRLGLSAQRILCVVIAGFSLLLMGVMFQGGLVLVESGTRQMSPVMQFRMSWMFLAVPVSTVILGIEIVLRVIERWHEPFGGDDEEVA
jgi:TRAP-type C4-dicarboxylate transport system permease small subunit